VYLTALGTYKKVTMRATCITVTDMLLLLLLLLLLLF
jgi:hypothetical protein